MNAVEKTAEAELPPLGLRATPDRTGSELKRGMFFNTIALLASIYVLDILATVFLIPELKGTELE